MFAKFQFSRKQQLFIGMLLVVIVIVNNWGISLWDQDEAAYAGFGYNMITTGDWLIPDFPWSDIHRKPPLHFWGIATAYKLFGVNEFAVRFFASLAIIFSYLLIYWQGKKFFGERESYIAVVVLGTSFLVPAMGKMAVTDGPLLLFSVLCTFALLNVLQFRSIKWTLIFWGSFALAMLTKGPPIIIYMGMLGLLLIIFHPLRKNLLMLHPGFSCQLPRFPCGIGDTERHS